MEIPRVPTLRSLGAHAPVPNASDYRISDPTIDETVSARTGNPLDVGDAFVLQVDRSTDTSIHAIPSSLEDEFIHLLTTDKAFRNRVQDLLGIPRN